MFSCYADVMTKTRFVGLAAVLLVVGCKKSDDAGSGAAASGDPSSCAGAIDSGLKTMMDARGKLLDARLGSATDGGEKKAKMLERSQKVVEQLRAPLTTRCTEDKWAPEVITCFATVTKREEIQACLAKLPHDIEKKANDDVMKAMTAGMRTRGEGGMMGSSHGGPLNGMHPLGVDPVVPPPAPTGTPSAPPAPAPATPPVAPAPK